MRLTAICAGPYLFAWALTPHDAAAGSRLIDRARWFFKIQPFGWQKICLTNLLCMEY